MDNENEEVQCQDEKPVGLIDGLLRWWYAPSKADLQERINFLECENERLVEKCAERGDENAALQAQLAALQMEIDTARRAYQAIRREVPHRILDGGKAGAVHEDRREYENNRLRVFVNQVHRRLSEVLNDVASLNKDLQRAKTATAGGMLEPDQERREGLPPGA